MIQFECCLLWFCDVHCLNFILFIPVVFGALPELAFKASARDNCMFCIVLSWTPARDL